MAYMWIAKGVLGFGSDCVRSGDILPEKYSNRVAEFLDKGMIERIEEDPSLEEKMEANCELITNHVDDSKPKPEPKVIIKKRGRPKKVKSNG